MLLETHSSSNTLCRTGNSDAPLYPRGSGCQSWGAEKGRPSCSFEAPNRLASSLFRLDFEFPRFETSLVGAAFTGLPDRHNRLNHEEILAKTTLLAG